MTQQHQQAQSQEDRPAGSDKKGRHATRPSHIPLAGWKQIGKRVLGNFGKHNASLIAAGVALYGLLAIFPALNVAVTLYALFASPDQVIEHVEPLSQLLPEQAFSIIENQLVSLAQQSTVAINFALLFSILLGFWSARKGMAAVMTACNVAYGEREQRPIWKTLLVSLIFTIGAIVGFVMVGLLVILMPVILELLPLGEWLIALFYVLRWPLLALLFIIALQITYRFAPDRENAKWRWVSWGAVIATLLWIGASLLFGLYVRNFGDFNETYGTIGGVIILILWFHISATAILLGAEINAEMEHQTDIDSTTGPSRPMGERGAFVADTTGTKRES